MVRLIMKTKKRRKKSMSCNQFQQFYDNTNTEAIFSHHRSSAAQYLHEKQTFQASDFTMKKTLYLVVAVIVAKIFRKHACCKPNQETRGKHSRRCALLFRCTIDSAHFIWNQLNCCQSVQSIGVIFGKIVHTSTSSEK